MGWEFRIVKSESYSQYLNKIQDCYAIHEVYVDCTGSIVKIEDNSYNLLEPSKEALLDNISKINQYLNKPIIDKNGQEI
jgi:hypothetical protein